MISKVEKVLNIMAGKKKKKREIQFPELLKAEALDLLRG